MYNMVYDYRRMIKTLRLAKSDEILKVEELVFSLFGKFQKMSRNSRGLHLAVTNV